MPRRMSNKNRIARRAEEAEAARKEKDAKAKGAKAKGAKARSASGGSSSRPPAAASGARLKLVWAVKEPNGNTLRTFAYPERKQAEAEAARLTEKKGREHFVASERVPMD